MPGLHHSPSCLHKNGWHDIAGALTVDGVHHVFQGCPNSSGGWSHASSTNVVNWQDNGIHIHKLNETYVGMESYVSPCSVFVTMDENGVVCSGFRQCDSSAGVTGLNRFAKKWDVPLEIRCATNDNITSRGFPEFILPFYVLPCIAL